MVTRLFGNLAGDRPGDRSRELGDLASNRRVGRRTKYLANKGVRAGIEKGLHAVFVHPGYVLRYPIGAAHASVDEVVGQMAERVGAKPPQALRAWVMKSMAHVMAEGPFGKVGRARRTRS